jgi:hypothetical protein
MNAVAKLKIEYKNSKKPEMEVEVSNFGITGVFFWFTPITADETTVFIPSDELSHVEIIKTEGA